jgi:hypothetical protein
VFLFCCLFGIWKRIKTKGSLAKTSYFFIKNKVANVYLISMLMRVASIFLRKKEIHCIEYFTFTTVNTLDEVIQTRDAIVS